MNLHIWAGESCNAKLFNPLVPGVHKSVRIDQITILRLEGIIKKKFLWASQLWVGRRKESILGYVPENDEKRIQALKG